MTTTTSQATLEHEIGHGGRFSLRQVSGFVTLRGSEGTAVRVRERNGKSLAEAFEIAAADGSLSLTEPDRGPFGLANFRIGRRSSLDLEVELPRGTDLSIEGASADIDGSGLAGQTRIRTASGDVHLTGFGGPLELDGVSGDIEIDADAPIALRVRTISGDCGIRAPRLTRAVVETTSGDLRLDAVLSGAGPFEVQTVSGDVVIVGRSGIRVEARTVTGDLRSELPHRRDTAPGRKLLVVGDGTATVGFRSVSGDLRVVAPRDALPPAVTEAAAATDQAAKITAAPAGLKAETAAQAHEAGHEVARLDVLRALERGELSVEAAMRRLVDIEEA
jgi:DUF4097 and DUF4098 domain-containing protein YvlB